MEINSDDRIRRDVIQSMSHDSRIGPNEIDVIINAGIVNLGGYVDSYRKKWAATNIVMSVQGVQNVVNHINVEAEDRTYDDDEIREAIKVTFENDPRIIATDLDILVSKGTVKLNGEVKTIAIKQLVSEDVRWTPGVIKVTNELEILPAKILPDEKVYKKLMNTLNANKKINLEAVHIFIKKGVITLSGTVPSYTEKVFIFKQTWSENGVINVVDNLKVQSNDNE